MIALELTQGTDEWKAARAGKVTASRIADVMAKGKGSGEAVTRRDYRFQIVAEILTGKPQDDIFVNDAMRWGTEQEPYARAAYEIQRGVLVEQVGLVIHPSIERGAASPDGLVGPDGLLEIKCPKTATHLDCLEAGAVPAKYQSQMLWQMACTGAKWCDFVSFDPRMPDHLQLFVKRFERDDTRIAEIEAEVKLFLEEVEAMVVSDGRMSLQALLKAHNAKRPEMPRPLPPATDPTYQAWLKAYTAWALEKEAIIAKDAVKGLQTDLQVRERAMREKACTPRADYEWRDIPARRSRATTPARSHTIGRPKTLPDTPAVERRRQTFRESKARRAALIREGLNHREDAA